MGGYRLPDFGATSYHACSFKTYNIVMMSLLPDNAVPIKSWFSEPHDTALLELLPLLDALRFTHDVRTVLSRNLHLHSLW